MLRKVYQVVLGIAFLLSAAAAQTPLADSSRRNPGKLAHPAVVLKDQAGRSVLETGKPMSIRQTCGEKCHDYDFIAGSFHFQQGKSEMDRGIARRARGRGLQLVARHVWQVFPDSESSTYRTPASPTPPTRT